MIVLKEALSSHRNNYLPWLLVFLLFLSFSTSVRAAPAYDHDNGTWTDTYADSNGLSAKSNVNVDTSDGKLKLTNAGGGFTPPFNTSGYGRTTSIIPRSVVQWGTITVTAETPENTAITIQVLDEGNSVYSNTLLSGNESGFSTSTIDLSGLPVERSANPGYAKIPRLRLKINLSTTDTDVTPALDSLLFSWTVSQGDLSASPMASTAWPTSEVNKKGTRHSLYSANPVYPVIRWIKDQGVSYGGKTTRGSGELIFNKTNGGYSAATGVLDAKLSALNRNTGATVWEKDISGYSFSDMDHTLTQNGTLYFSDIFNDVLFAYDTTDGSLKWTYQFYGSHSNQNVTVADDGTIYTARENGSVTIYAFNPDGTVKWSKEIAAPDDPIVRQPIFADDGTVYVATTTLSGANFANNGKLYALSPTDGTILWEYETGDVWASLVGSDGTIYTAHFSNTSMEKKIYAINSDGTLKWERNIGVSTERWSALSLRSDGILLAHRVPASGAGFSVEAIDITDGSLLWTQSFSDSNSYYYFFTDANNGFYVDSYTLQTEGNLFYYDANHNQKWRLKQDGYYWIRYSILDEAGRLYANLYNSDERTNALFALFPWTQTVAVTGSSTGYYAPGDQLTLTVTTAMQETNLLSGESNQIQVVMDNGDKVTLSYDSANGDGDTVWTGSYTLPSSITDGSHSFTVEANAAGIQTDISVNFASAATNTNNTGYTTTGSFTVDNTPPSVELVSPYGYTNQETKPTLVFKKATDSVSGLTSTYSVNLDEGKNQVYSSTGIPTSGNGTANYVWKDDTNTKVEFINEEDGDSTNDLIKVYFRKLDAKPLTEGTHSWNVVTVDSANNYSTTTNYFHLDLTNPTIDNLAITGSKSQANSLYTLSSSTPTFSGTATDSYQGSTSSNTNQTTDSFDQVASGPEKITLTLKKLKPGQNPNSANPVYQSYHTQDYTLTNITDEPNYQKTASFSITPNLALVPGYYQAELNLLDQAGNTSTTTVYLDFNYPGRGGEQLKLKITEKKEIPFEQKETKEEIRQYIKEYGYQVEIKVLDDNGSPVKGARVELHSEPKVAYTNNQGIASFQGVEPGKHTVKIAYQNKVGEQELNLEGEVKGFAIEVKVKEKPSFWLYGVIGVLVVVILAGALYLLRIKSRLNKLKSI